MPTWQLIGRTWMNMSKSSLTLRSAFSLLFILTNSSHKLDDHRTSKCLWNNAALTYLDWCFSIDNSITYMYIIILIFLFHFFWFPISNFLSSFSFWLFFHFLSYYLIFFFFSLFSLSFVFFILTYFFFFFLCIAHHIFFVCGLFGLLFLFFFFVCPHCFLFLSHDDFLILFFSSSSKTYLVPYFFPTFVSSFTWY